jgi:hypothetical protein
MVIFYSYVSLPEGIIDYIILYIYIYKYMFAGWKGADSTDSTARLVTARAARVSSPSPSTHDEKSRVIPCDL